MHNLITICPWFDYVKSCNILRDHWPCHWKTTDPICFQHFIQCLDNCPTFTSHPNGKIRISVMRYSAIHCRTTHFQEILMKKEKNILNFIVCSCTFQPGSLARSTGSQPKGAATNFTDCICMHMQHMKTSH